MVGNLTELRPNKQLLDPNFEGYKLSLDPIPIYASNLECGVDHVLPSEDQYTFQHVKIFGLHNHLYEDPWCRDEVYFIDKKWRVKKSVTTYTGQRMQKILDVWELPSHHQRVPGHYNTSLSFSSSDLAVLSDGAGTLHLVSTGSRAESDKWKVLFSDEVCGAELPFLILHSRCIVREGRRQVHCLLMHIDELKTTDSEVLGPKFGIVLDWITLVEGEMLMWTIKSVRRLESSGDLHYAAVDNLGQSLYIVSRLTFEYVMDSELPVEQKHNNTTPEPPPSKPMYFWRQTLSDITVWFQAPETTPKSDMQVSVDSRHLSVKYKNEVLLEGELWHQVDHECTTWTYDRGKLEVCILKSEEGLMWQEFVKGDKRGEEVPDPVVVEEIHQRLAHLCSDKEVTDGSEGCAPGFNPQQLEECDAFPSDQMQLVRLDCQSHSISHQVNLGGHQWLFSTQLDTDKVPAFCLRHDVDGCLWQPEDPQDSPTWPCAHVGTFLAFGYVQASKTQKKFSVCPPGLSYVAVCESNSHIYIYRQPTDIVGEVRNRRTGQRINSVCKQHLITLPSQEEVLGVSASDHILQVLTTGTLYALQINNPT